MSKNKAPLKGLSQESVFYTDTWTQLVDKRFIELLRVEKLEGRFDPTRKNTVSIRKALKVLNEEFNTKFEFSFAVDRVNKLQRRYKTFYYISKYKGITFNLETQKIECDAELWEKFCKSKRLAMAYATQGEAEFDNLRFIFKQEDDSVGWHRLEDIVQISSNLSELSVPDGVGLRREILEGSSDLAFWRYVAGNGFGSSSGGPSLTFHTPATSTATEVTSSNIRETKKMKQTSEDKPLSPSPEK